MRTTRRRITQSRGAQCVAGATFLFAIALFIPGVTQRFNTAVTWRPAGPFFSPAGQVKFDHSGNATMEEAPAEEAAAAATEGGQEGGHIEEQINLSAMSEEQLADALMWWQSSQKIDSAHCVVPVSADLSAIKSGDLRMHSAGAADSVLAVSSQALLSNTPLRAHIAAVLSISCRPTMCFEEICFHLTALSPRGALPDPAQRQAGVVVGS